MSTQLLAMWNGMLGLSNELYGSEVLFKKPGSTRHLRLEVKPDYIVKCEQWVKKSESDHGRQYGHHNLAME